MAKDSQSNIFDSPSEQNGAALGKKQSDKELPPEIKTTSKIPVNKKYTITDQEIVDMVKRIEYLQKDLEIKLSMIKDKIPLTSMSVTKFLNDKNNFPPEQWSIIQENRKEMEQKLLQMMGESNKAKQKILQEKGAKEYRSKTLGSRRKWIPIR